MHGDVESETADDAPETPTDLAATKRWIIVAIAFLQGVALLAAYHGLRGDYPPFMTEFGWLTWVVVVISAPTAVALCLTDWRDTHPWAYGAIVAVVLGGSTAHVGYQLTGHGGLSTLPLMFPLGVGLAILVFIATPFAQCWLTHRRPDFDYTDLFHHAWNNTLTLVVALVFTGLFWLLLILWQVLFSLIEIEVFSDVFGNEGFIYPFTGLALGLGVVIGRTQQRAVIMLRMIVLAVFKGLLPVVAFVAILFILSLPFAGLELLWKTDSAASILMIFMIALITFTNGVFQDGGQNAPYPKLVRRMVEAALVLLPLYGVIAGYGLWLRIVQHGWTSYRVWAVIICLTLTLYAVSYAHGALRPKAIWLGGIARQNVLVAQFIIAILVITNLPWVNPRAIGVASQVQRLLDGTTDAGRYDFSYLRFEAGRDGVEALKALRADPRISAIPSAVKAMDHALASSDNLYDGPNNPHKRALVESEIRESLAIYPADAILPPALLTAFTKIDTPRIRACLGSRKGCVIFPVDLNRDQNAEYVLFDGDDTYSSFVIYAQGEAGEWDWLGWGRLSNGRGKSADELKTALQRGEIKTRAHDWDRLFIGELEMTFRPR